MEGGGHTGGQPMVVESNVVEPPAISASGGYISGFLPDLVGSETAHPAPDYSTGPVDPTTETGGTVDDLTAVTTELDRYWTESPAQPQPDELTVPPRFITTGELIDRVNATGVQAIADSLGSNDSGEPAAVIPTTAAKLAGLQQASASAVVSNVYDTGEQRWVNEGGPDGEPEPAATAATAEAQGATESEVGTPLFDGVTVSDDTGKYDIRDILNQLPA
ncbi:MAG TPA: hypothetical protein VLG40_02170 [Candidatus Saccharimonas sp.]|nr:hypothetical protein [Candidatus Saccharimonas sp.]